jgi:hypothetical protein
LTWFWSPESRWIAFFANAKLKKIDVTGGPPLVPTMSSSSPATILVMGAPGESLNRMTINSLWSAGTLCFPVLPSVLLIPIPNPPNFRIADHS